MEIISESSQGKLVIKSNKVILKKSINSKNKKK